jgi:hypothetical protein
MRWISFLAVSSAGWVPRTIAATSLSSTRRISTWSPARNEFRVNKCGVQFNDKPWQRECVAMLAMAACPRMVIHDFDAE